MNPMFAKFDQALGKTTPTPSNGQPLVTSRADEIRNLAKQATPAPVEKKPGFFSTIGNAIISSEKAVGNDLTAGIRASMETKNEDMLYSSQANSEKVLQDHINTLKASGKDSTHAEQALAGIKANSIAPQAGDFAKNVPESTKTNLQGLGDVAGVGLDVLSAGTYGTAAKGMQAGKIAVQGTKSAIAANALSKVGIGATIMPAKEVAKEGTKLALSQTLKNIGEKTLEKTAVGAGTGYAYDVAGNLQQGKTGGEALTPGIGTALGGTIPLVIGGIQATAAITKDLAPRFINSLIKPKQANFAYGKDPGRTVSEMGITGNSMDDFGNNINKARNEVGTQIGEVYSNPKNANLTINASDEITKIDKAIAEAAKGGKSNQSIVTALQNTKDALLYEHAIDAQGNIVKASAIPENLMGEVNRHIDSAKMIINETPGIAINEVVTDAKKNIIEALKHDGANDIANKISSINTAVMNNVDDFKSAVEKISSEGKALDLSKLNPQQAFDLKQKIASATKFTGNPSDDKTVNAVLKNIYGGVTEKVNKAVEVNNPEIRNLNEKYGDLVSAELATKNRDMITKRADMISMPVKVGGATALITAISTGGAAIPVILAGAGAAALDKALESTAVKTRIATWLGSATPSMISKIPPEIKTVLYRALPKFASQLGQNEQ